MRFHIRPGKVTCAGIVAIFMVLPNSIWTGPDAKVAPAPKPKIEKLKIEKLKIEKLKQSPDSNGRRVKFRKVPR